MGYWTSLNLNEFILIVSFKQNLNLKIQILAGFSAGSQISSTLVIGAAIEMLIWFLFFKIPTRSNLDHITEEIAKKAGRCLNQDKSISLVFLLKIPNAYKFCKEVKIWLGYGLDHGQVNYG